MSKAIVFMRFEDGTTSYLDETSGFSMNKANAFMLPFSIACSLVYYYRSLYTAQDITIAVEEIL